MRTMLSMNTFQVLSAVIAWGLCSSLVSAADDRPSDRWEAAIAAFEQADAEHPPQPGQILFVGSSSIRKWDLEKWFPDLKTINRGFGGSQLKDVVHFFDRVVTPYRPRIVVVYAGDNDVAAGRTPQEIHQSFRAFVKKMDAALPNVPVVYIAVKPSLARWKMIDDIRETNRLIQQDCQQDPSLTFLDIAAPMIGDDGKPRPDLFVKDGLHLSDKGYDIWTRLLMPHLKPQND